MTTEEKIEILSSMTECLYRQLGGNRRKIRGYVHRHFSSLYEILYDVKGDYGMWLDEVCATCNVSR